MKKVVVVFLVLGICMGVEYAYQQGYLHAWFLAEKPVKNTVPEEVAESPKVTARELLAEAAQYDLLEAGEEDFRKAFRLYDQAAEMGDVWAQLHAGSIAAGPGDKVMLPSIAVHWFRKAAEQGHPIAQYWLGKAYQNGLEPANNEEGLEVDHTLALEWLKKAADQGESRAQYALGRIYEDGIGVDQDAAEAMEWFRMVAAQLHRLIPPDSTADYANLAWYWKGIESEVLAAQCTLGEAYAFGVGVEKSEEEALKWYLKSAEGGFPIAQAAVGILYENGVGVEKDMEEALKWYRKAAEEGLTKAQVSLAERYLRGIDVPQDDVEAMKWARMAAEQGDPAAQFYLASGYHDGKGVPQDNAAAVRWFRKAAEQGDAPSQAKLGFHLKEGLGTPVNFEEAAEWFRKAAEQDMDIAQWWLARLYREGLGVPLDLDSSMEWLRKAAEQGLDLAQYELALAFSLGRGVEQSDVEAAKWYQLAAEQGLDKAQNNLSVAYAQGRGVEKNLETSVQWLRKAADQGVVESQHSLGACYLKGEGVEKDPAEAMRWFRKAAEQDFAFSQYLVGFGLATGDGVEKNPVEAVGWFRKAAELGYSESQFELGRMYYLGEGVPKNEVESYQWLLLAAAQGHERARKLTELMEQEMSVLQRAEGQRLASLFVARDRNTSVDSAEEPGMERSLDNFVAFGSGFFITADGYLVTNHHVVGGGAEVTVVTPSGEYPARQIAVDENNDLALLKVEGESFAHLAISPSRAVGLGETVFTVGFPNVMIQGFAPKLAKGEIAGLSGAMDNPRDFQISVPLQPGNSGGALINEQGSVVGVVSGKLSAEALFAISGSLPENVNYAIKSSYLLSFLESVPEVLGQLKEPDRPAANSQEAVGRGQSAAVLILVN